MLYNNEILYGEEFEREVLQFFKDLKAGDLITDSTRIGIVDQKSKKSRNTITTCDCRLTIPGTDYIVTLAHEGNDFQVIYDYTTFPVAVFNGSMLELPEKVLFYFSRVLKCTIYLEDISFMINEEVKGDIKDYILTVALRGKSMFSIYIPYNVKTNDIVCTNISAVFANLFICPFNPTDKTTEIRTTLENFMEDIVNRIDKLFTSLYLLYNGMINNYKARKLNNGLGYQVKDIIVIVTVEGIFLISLDGRNYTGSETAKSIKKIFNKLNTFKGLPLLNNFTSANLVKKYTDYYDVVQI